LSLYQSGDKEINKTVDDVFIPLELKEKKLDKSDQSEEYQKKNQFFPISYQTFLDDKLEQGNTEKSRGERVAIVGEPGAGKTTLLQYTAYRLLKEDRFEFDIPIVIFIKQLTDFNADNPIKDQIDQVIEQTNNFDKIKNSSKVKLWLFLDGVDEVNSEHDILFHLNHWINNLDDLYNKGYLPKIKVVLNCRINTWVVDLNHPLSNFETFYTSEITPDQVKQFIDESFFREEPEKADELKKQLFETSQNRRLKDLVKNPLMLTMLCAIWEETQTQSEGLPNTQFELYRKYIRFYKKWNDNKKSSNNKVLEQDFNNLIQFLGILGRNALDRNETNLSPYQIRISDIDKAKSELKQKLEESYIYYLKKLALNLGLLEKQQQGASEEESYFFFHPTFQEFFAAWVIDDWDFFLPRYHTNYPVKDESGKYKPYRVFDPQWKQVILFWVGRRDEQQQEQKQQDFIFHLENFEAGFGNFNFYRIRGHCLIAACIPELLDYGWTLQNNPEILWVEHFVEYIVRFAVVEYIEAKEALKETDSHLASQFLISYLQHENNDLRSVELLPVKWALKFQVITDRNIIQSLISCLQYENWEVRKTVTEALEGTTYPDAIKALISCLQYENNSVGWSAVWSLRGTTNPEAISALISHLQYENESVRSKAAQALKGTTDPDAIKVLISRLQEEEDWTVQEHVELALSGTTKDNNTIQSLVYCLQDENREVRKAATKALEGTTDTNAIKTLISCLQDKNEDSFVRFSAAGALEGTTDPDVIKTLISCLQDKNEDNLVRRSATDALQGTTDPDAIKALISCLKDEDDESVRGSAAQALQGTTDPNAIQALISCVQDENEDTFVQRSAIAVLWGTTDSDAIKAFICCLHNENEIWVVIDLVKHALHTTTENLSYPCFYQIWHEENSSSKSESLNLTQLPTLLNRTVNEAKLSEEVQVICIDNNQFLNPDNPYYEIYKQMLNQGCSKSEEKPYSAVQFQDYWDYLRQDDSLPIPVLVFYQNPNIRYQYFSETFLDKLSRAFQGLIGLVTDQEQPFPLQTFSPQQPDLNQAIVAWIRGTLLEN